MDELEVFFCELCNTSVPEVDLDSGRATRFRGRVIGGCCLENLHPAVDPAAAAQAIAPVAMAGGQAPVAAKSAGVIPAVFIVLIAVAGSAMFSDWRLSAENKALREELVSVKEQGKGLGNHMLNLEKRLSTSLAKGDLRVLEERLGTLRESLGEREARLGESLAGTKTQVQRLLENVAGMTTEQGQQNKAMTSIGEEVRNLRQDIAELRAAPQPVVSSTPEFDDGGAAPGLVDATGKAAGDGGLPPEIAHNLVRLKDSDAGARFEAVDGLLQAQDPRAFAAIMPLTKDPDPFVRRLVVEGIADYRANESVDALIVALADPESIVRHTAYTSLKKLSGQALAFDPDASSAKRNTAQGRWKSWWEKSKAKFF